MKFLNLACGDSYISSANWTNIDYIERRGVTRCDLLGPLPFGDQSFAGIYCSHFLEHIPYSRIPKFLAECHRLLIPGGTIRIVTPDFENMCRYYLSAVDVGDRQRAEYATLAILDQCTREGPGGRLGKFAEHCRENNPDLYAEIVQRQGNFHSGVDERTTDRWHRRQVTDLFRSGITKTRISLGLSLLPEAFRRQNTIRVHVGELHRWLYDFASLGEVLRQAGFEAVTRESWNQSRLFEHALGYLDADGIDQPRKGLESMFVEAQRPT